MTINDYAADVIKSLINTYSTAKKWETLIADFNQQFIYKCIKW